MAMNSNDAGVCASPVQPSQRVADDPGSAHSAPIMDSPLAGVADKAAAITLGMSCEKCTPEPLVQNIWNYILTYSGSNPQSPVYASKPLLLLLREAEALLRAEPTVLELKGTVTVIGGIHGQGDSLVSLMANGGFPPTSTYIFLGNYTGPGFAPHEVLFMLLAWKVKYPKNVYLLKGRMEDSNVLKSHDFVLGLQNRQLFEDVLVWAFIEKIVDEFPLAAVLNKNYFFVSGGVGPALMFHGLSGLKKVEKPPTLAAHIAMTIECQWAALKLPNDDDNVTDGSPVFTEQMVDEFCQKNKLKMIIRSRQIVADGILNFPKRMLTIWSANSYLDNFRNSACGIRINGDMNTAVVFQCIQHEESPKSLDEAKPASGRNVIVI